MEDDNYNLGPSTAEFDDIRLADVVWPHALELIDIHTR